MSEVLDHEALRLLAGVMRALMRGGMTDDNCAVWLETPSPWLDDDRRPIDMIADGEGDRVLTAAHRRSQNYEGPVVPGLGDGNPS